MFEYKEKKIIQPAIRTQAFCMGGNHCSYYATVWRGNICGAPNGVTSFFA